MLVSLCCKFYHLQEWRGLSEVQRFFMDVTTRTYILEYLNSLFQSRHLIQPKLQLTVQCLQDQEKTLVFSMWMHLQTHIRQKILMTNCFNAKKFSFFQFLNFTAYREANCCLYLHLNCEMIRRFTWTQTKVGGLKSFFQKVQRQLSATIAAIVLLSDY